MRKLIPIIVTIIALLFLVGCYDSPYETDDLTLDNFVSESPQEKAITQKQEPSTTNIEKPIIQKEQSKAKSPSEELLNFLENTFSSFATISKESEDLINEFSSEKITKEELCSKLNAKEENFNPINSALANKNVGGDIALKERFNKLLSRLITIGKQMSTDFENVNSYCSGGSILKLTDAESDFDRIARGYEMYYVDGSRTKPSPWGSTIPSLETISVMFEQIRGLLQTSSGDTQESYGVGDTIEKNGLKVTLNEAKKNYASIEYSYFVPNSIWTDEEWLDIKKYFLGWSGAYETNIKKQMEAEINQKYYSKLPETLKYQYFDYTVEGSTKELRSKRKSFLFIPSKEYIFEEKFDMNDGYIRGLFYLYPEDRNEKVKLIITFEGCGKNKEEIEAIESQGICPQTFIFDVDLFQLS